MGIVDFSILGLLDQIVIDVVPVEIEAETGLLGQEHIPIIVQRIHDRVQVRRRRLIVEIGTE